ncbi:reactive intermediate/imine deaminase [Deltaproteobacteria bacterium]|nr:reactive intermediate/imine deaminase [Deltaproteobacteria bacterium]
MAEFITTPKAPSAIGPYVQGRMAGNLLFVSGQLGIGSDGVLPPDFTSQARNSLQNVRAIVEAAGSSVANVVKTTVFLSDMANFAELNALYAEVFTAPCPARSCIQVARLPKDALVEIEAVAERQDLL